MSGMVDILRWTVRLVFGIAFGTLAYGIAVSPTREPNRLGLRGLKRQKALANVEGWSAIEPFVRWLGLRVGRVLSEPQREKIDELITRAGDFMGLTPDEYVALSLVGTVLGVVTGVGVGIYMDYPVRVTMLVFGMFGTAGLHLHLQGVAEERLKQIARALPYAVDLMALSMSAGLDFPAATRQVVEKTSTPDDPLVEEFTLILQSLNLGRTRQNALRDFARRCPNESVQEFVNAVVQAEERGNPVAEVLSIQAGISRTRRSIRAEESAAKAAAKLVLPLLMVLGVVFLLLVGPVLIGLTDSI